MHEEALEEVEAFIILFFAFGLAAIWGFKNAGQAKGYGELTLRPQTQARGWPDDGYNGVLIKDLLGKSRPFGEVKLTQREMERYMTTEWYFGQIPEEAKDFLTGDAEYLKEQNQAIGLTNIMPQHYHNNYRIAFWILHYGWIPASLLRFPATFWHCLSVRTFLLRDVTDQKQAGENHSIFLQYGDHASGGVLPVGKSGIPAGKVWRPALYFGGACQLHG